MPKGAKRRVVTNKEIKADHPYLYEFVVTFDDGIVARTFKHKYVYTAASFPTFRTFLQSCKVGDAWEDEIEDEYILQPKDNSSDKTDK